MIGTPGAPDAVAAVRAFNRFYTRTIGVLEAGLAGTRYSLTEARVLYELAQRGPTEVAELRRDLGLDAGYLSRILARFTTDGLTVQERSAADARRRVVRLTDAGSAAFAQVDEQQAAAVRQVLAPLPDGERDRLVAAMGTIRDVLGDGRDRTGCVLRPPGPGDLGWMIARHGVLCATELRADLAVEAHVARILAEHTADHATDHATDHTAGSATWIAELDGERVGSALCAVEGGAGATTARLHLLLVEPAARGGGIGTRLVEECARSARRFGCSRLAVTVPPALVAARRLVARTGFRENGRSDRRLFGQDVVAQEWVRDL